MSENLVFSMTTPAGHRLRHETQRAVLNGVNGSTLQVTGERQYYVDDIPVKYWSYDPVTNELEILDYE